MQIDMPHDDQQRLEQAAIAAGYEDVVEFAAHHLQAIAMHNVSVDLLSRSDDELRESAAECDAAMKRIKSGDGRPFGEAMQSIADKVGIDLQR